MILSVGRLIEKKGLVDLLLACELLRRRGRPFQVEIIGTGPWEGLLKAQAKRLGLTANVNSWCTAARSGSHGLPPRYRLCPSVHNQRQGRPGRHPDGIDGSHG